MLPGPLRCRTALGGLVLALLAPVARGQAGPPLPLATVADAPLTGRTTRWDYASLDPAHHRLFLAHLGDGVVSVFDTHRQGVVADIPGVSSVHGVLAIPSLDRVYASATGTDEVVAIDATSLKIVARVPT